MGSETKKHQKHANLARPGYGLFHRNEWSILGTPCGNIKQLAYGIINRLSDKYRLGYADADHAGAEKSAAPADGAMAQGAIMEYTDKIAFQRFDWKGTLDTYQFRVHFNSQDAVLVNGNHFEARTQIVVVDPKKEDSLRRKLDRLTDVRLLLLAEGVKEVFPWLKEALENYSDIPQMKLQDVDGIALLLERDLEAARPPLYGLVLAGGHSARMGEDKGLIQYYGMPQREYLAGLLQPLCQEVFTSCRAEQADEVLNPLPDTIEGLGPFGGLLSAFRRYPDVAWLVIACDLPLLDEETIMDLIQHRNTSKIATAFNSPTEGFPEPLIAIWEPRSYPVMLQFLAQGYSCPRKVLINSEVQLLDAGAPQALRNVNTPEELEEVREMIALRP
jgi:molybdopterin-guanine dinucleotide biosynthesis protein A